MSTKLKQIAHFVLNLIFPQTTEARLLEHITAETIKMRATPAPPSHHDTRALFSYQDPLIHAVVKELKFRRNINLGTIIAELMYEALLEDLADASLFRSNIPIALVPVPMTRTSLGARGFNQCLHIAQCIEQQDNASTLRVFDVVDKIRDTLPQSRTRTRNERFKNIEGAFRIRPDANMSGKEVLVIDDVITTGATFAEIKRVLLDAGATTVRGLFFSH